MPSKRLVASYVFDWVLIIALAAAGGGLNFVTPYHRPFSLVDLTISYPYVERQLIPVWLLVVVSLLAPAAVISIVALVMVPGSAARRAMSPGQAWRIKLWEWYVGWTGLALSFATAFFLTQGLKNLFGKARPDLLARCNPRVDRLSEFLVSNYAASINPEWVLVSSHICDPISRKVLDDGFRSFPSGHSSMSWSGLLYLSLFLCSKFAVAIPYASNPTSRPLPLPSTAQPPAQDNATTEAEEFGPRSTITPYRNRAAAPPVLGMLLAATPVLAALYICSTRYSQFFHFGFDIIAGAVIGILTSWVSFRWYHLPVRRGAGWAWGARARGKAWGIGVGVENYAEESFVARGVTRASSKRPGTVESAVAFPDDVESVRGPYQ